MRIVVIDDHIAIHRSISLLLDIEDDIELVGQGGNGKEAVALCNQHQPDILLIDVIMPLMDGIEAMKIISHQQPNTKILALSSFEDKNSIHEALQAGASGYLIKHTALNNTLASAIRAVHTGKIVLSPEVLHTLISRTTDQPIRNYNLSQRELDVLQFLVTGLTNQQIADDLTISISTVKFHVSSIFNKLGVSNRIQAVTLAINEKLVI